MTASVKELTHVRQPRHKPRITDCPQKTARFTKNKRVVISRLPKGAPVCLHYAGGLLQEVTPLTADGNENMAEYCQQWLQGAPKTIGYSGELEVYGTIVFLWEGYKRLLGYNAMLPPPCELAVSWLAGEIFAIDVLPELIVWDCRRASGSFSKLENLKKLREWGFTTADYRAAAVGLTEEQVKNLQNHLHFHTCDYPTEALLFEHDAHNDDDIFKKTVALTWPVHSSVDDRLELV